MSIRKKYKRQLKKTFFLFCEGKTEELYFTALRQNQRYNLQVKTYLSNQLTTKPSSLESVYIKMKKQTKYNDRDMKDTGSHMYYLLDADVYTDTQIKTINIFADIKSFLTIIRSDPYFEVWLAMHYGVVKTNSDVDIPIYTKPGTLRLFVDMIVQGLERAIKHAEHRPKKSRGPTTDVGRAAQFYISSEAMRGISCCISLIACAMFVYQRSLNIFKAIVLNSDMLGGGFHVLILE